MTEQPWSESRIETKSEQASRWTEWKTNPSDKTNWWNMKPEQIKPLNKKPNDYEQRN